MVSSTKQALHICKENILHYYKHYRKYYWATTWKFLYHTSNSYLQVQLVLTHNYKERKGAKGAQLTVPSVMLHWGNNQFAQNRYSSPNISEKKVSSSLNNKQCFTDNPLFYLTSEKKPVVYILLLEKNAQGSKRVLHFYNQKSPIQRHPLVPGLGLARRAVPW